MRSTQAPSNTGSPHNNASAPSIIVAPSSSKKIKKQQLPPIFWEPSTFVENQQSWGSIRKGQPGKGNKWILQELKRVVAILAKNEITQTERTTSKQLEKFTAEAYARHAECLVIETGSFDCDSWRLFKNPLSLALMSKGLVSPSLFPLLSTSIIVAPTGKSKTEEAKDAMVVEVDHYTHESIFKVAGEAVKLVKELDARYLKLLGSNGLPRSGKQFLDVLCDLKASLEKEQKEKQDEKAKKKPKLGSEDGENEERERRRGGSPTASHCSFKSR
jgi:hypothetical protein